MILDKWKFKFVFCPYEVNVCETKLEHDWMRVFRFNNVHEIEIILGLHFEGSFIMLLQIVDEFGTFIENFNFKWFSTEFCFLLCMYYLKFVLWLLN